MKTKKGYQRGKKMRVFSRVESIEERIERKKETLNTLSADLASELVREMSTPQKLGINSLQKQLEERTNEHEESLLDEKIPLYEEALKIAKLNKYV